jgi:16S rRNA (guanine527-N7)-methyltransferase
MKPAVDESVIVIDSKDQIQSAIIKLGLSCSQDQAEVIRQYLLLVLQANQKMNLVSKSNEISLVKRHFIDSLYLLRIYPFHHEAFVLDIGSGAGFPAIPLKIIRPDLVVCMYESITKKARFLEETIGKLGLKNIEIINERLTRNTRINTKVDYITARAVAELKELVKTCASCLGPATRLLTFKHASSLEKEIQVINNSRYCKLFEIEKVFPYAQMEEQKGICIVSLKKRKKPLAS